MRQSTLCLWVLRCGAGPSIGMQQKKAPSSGERKAHRGTAVIFARVLRRGQLRRRTRAKCGPHSGKASARRSTEPKSTTCRTVKLSVRQSDGFLGIGEVKLRVFVQQFQAAFTVHFRSNQVDVGAGA